MCSWTIPLALCSKALMKQALSPPTCICFTTPSGWISQCTARHWWSKPRHRLHVYASLHPRDGFPQCTARHWWSKPQHRLHVNASLHPRDGFPHAQQDHCEHMIETFVHTAFQLYGIKQDKPIANYFFIITVKQEQAIFHYNNNIVMSRLCNIAFNNIKWSEV